jgi:hypothetical protein
MVGITAHLMDAKYKFTKVKDFVFTSNVDFAGSGGSKLIQRLVRVGHSQFHRLCTAGQL